MRISIDKGEWYPMYSIDIIDDGDPYSTWVEVSEDKAEKWLKLDEQFMNMQRELANLYEEEKDE